MGAEKAGFLKEMADRDANGMRRGQGLDARGINKWAVRLEALVGGTKAGLTARNWLYP